MPAFAPDGHVSSHDALRLTFKLTAYDTQDSMPPALPPHPLAFMWLKKESPHVRPRLLPLPCPAHKAKFLLPLPTAGDKGGPSAYLRTRPSRARHHEVGVEVLV